MKSAMKDTATKIHLAIQCTIRTLNNFHESQEIVSLTEVPICTPVTVDAFSLIINILFNHRLVYVVLIDCHAARLENK